MKRKFVVVMALCLLALVVTSIGGCKQLKGITGNLAGQLVDTSGTGIGYLSVALFNAESGKEVDRQIASDSGNFFFREVEAGTYDIRIFDLMSNERSTDCEPIKLGTGRTKTITIVLQ